MEKFKNKYRIPSARLQTWDYGNNGSYFITICTKNRDHLFGEMVDGIDGPHMQLNEMGKLAEQFWTEIPARFPFIKLGNFVVMPNHFHGILIIDKPKNGTKTIKTGMDVDDNVIDIVETPLMAPLQYQQCQHQQKYLNNNLNENPIGTRIIKRLVDFHMIKIQCSTKIFREFVGGIKGGVHLKLENYIQILNGNHDSMTT